MASRGHCKHSSNLRILRVILVVPTFSEGLRAALFRRRPDYTRNTAAVEMIVAQPSPGFIRAGADPPGSPPMPSYVRSPRTAVELMAVECFRQFGNMFWTKTAATTNCLYISLHPLHCSGGEFFRLDQRVEIPVGTLVATAIWVDSDRT